MCRHGVRWHSRKPDQQGPARQQSSGILGTAGFRRRSICKVMLSCSGATCSALRGFGGVAPQSEEGVSRGDMQDLEPWVMLYSLHGCYIALTTAINIAI